MSFDTGDVARVTAKMTFQGEDQQNVYHVKNFDAGSLSDEDAVEQIALRLDAAYAEVAAQQHEDLDYTTIEVFNVTQDAPMGEVAWPTVTSGAINLQDPLPSQTAILALFPTKTARSQGRKFIGGVIEGDSANGVPDSDILNAAIDMMAIIVAPWLVSAGTFAFGNWSTAKVRFAKWISSTVRTVFRTQRRRAKLVGS